MKMVAAASKYYTDDDPQCTLQSPNRKDVVTATVDDEKVKVAKRYMKRSIRETYRIFKEQHSTSKVGLTKFYSLRPKWVKIQPQHEVCVCVYCANFHLCISAVRSSCQGIVDADMVKCFYLCNDPTEQCYLQQCQNCPREEGITLEKLRIDEDEDIRVATWEGGQLVKKELDATEFLNEVRKWTAANIAHGYIRGIQSTLIHDCKTSVPDATYILHYDFAENWTVVLPDEVQSYHWSKQQLSIFTCVVKTQHQTESFAAVSQDLSHDSAHALFARKAVEDWLDENLPIAKNVVYISDGAASHFMNRFMLSELGKTDFHEARWMFTATGHGKSACDGVGGIVKHYATLHNLRCPAREAILTPRDLIHSLSSKLKGVHLLHLPSELISELRTAKNEEWASVKSFPGIQSSHVWLSKTNNGTRELYIARTGKSKLKNVSL